MGRGQLAESLRADPRRRLHGADARGAPRSRRRGPLTLPEPVSLTVADVSFISLTRLLRGMAAATPPAATSCPWSSRSSSCRPATCPAASFATRAARGRRHAGADHAVGLGLSVLGEVESPLVGPSGNHELFLRSACPRT